MCVKVLDRIDLPFFGRGTGMSSGSVEVVVPSNRANGDGGGSGGSDVQVTGRLGGAGSGHGPLEEDGLAGTEGRVYLGEWGARWVVTRGRRAASRLGRRKASENLCGNGASWQIPGGMGNNEPTDAEKDVDPARAHIREMPKMGGYQSGTKPVNQPTQLVKHH